MYEGDSDSLQFIGDLMNYFRAIDRTEGRTNKLANGSILFSFDQDFAAPLDFGKEASSNVLQVLDVEEEELLTFARSTVPESRASATGGKSVTGEAPAGNSNNSKVAAFPAQETDNTQQAAKETSEVTLTVENPVEEAPAEDAPSEAIPEEVIPAEEPAEAASAAEENTEAAPAAEENTEAAPAAEENTEAVPAAEDPAAETTLDEVPAEEADAAADNNASEN